MVTLMKLLKKDENSSVALLQVQISEDELDVYERALRYVIEKCDEKETEEILGDKVLGLNDENI